MSSTDHLFTGQARLARGAAVPPISVDEIAEFSTNGLEVIVSNPSRHHADTVKAAEVEIERRVKAEAERLAGGAVHLFDEGTGGFIGTAEASKAAGN